MKVVRTLYRGPLKADQPVALTWNGRNEQGQVPNLEPPLPAPGDPAEPGSRHGLPAANRHRRARRLVTASALQLAGDAGRLRERRRLPPRARSPGSVRGRGHRADRRPAAGGGRRLALVAPGRAPPSSREAGGRHRTWPPRPWPPPRPCSGASSGRFRRRASRPCPSALPVQLGGETSHLLVPLYLVIAGGLVCLALRGAVRSPREPPRPRPGANSSPGPGRLARRHVALPSAGSDPGAVCDPDRLLGGRLQRDRERLLLPGPVRGDADAARRGALDEADPGRGSSSRCQAWP